MAISKVVYKSSPSATPVTWMDATTATAAAADITAPKTAMLADGVITTGTGSGSGGSGSVEYGTFTVASDIGLADAGTTVTIGFSGHPDFLYVWMDKASYEDEGSWVNNKHRRFCLVRNDETVLSTFPYIRYSASQDYQTLLDGVPYIRATSPNVITTTDEDNPTGYSINGAPSFYNRNLNVNAINSDGTITFTRHSTASSYIPAGTYHYYAVTGMTIYPM